MANRKTKSTLLLESMEIGDVVYLVESIHFPSNTYHKYKRTYSFVNKGVDIRTLRRTGELRVKYQIKRVK